MMKGEREVPAGFLFLWIVLVGMGASLITGCASVDRSDYRQTVLVQSDPPGAKIYNNNREIGVTPAYVRVRRGVHPHLHLLLPDGQERDLRLETHYRWGDSFASDFILLTLAPVGWGIDLLTGTAWHIHDPPLQQFENPQNLHATDTPKDIAIAPTIGVAPDAAASLGPLLAQKLENSTSFHIIAYDTTAPLFNYYNSDAGLTDNRTLRYNLFNEIKADHVLVTEASPKDEGYSVTGHLHNTITGEDSQEYNWSITTSDGMAKQELLDHRFFEKYFHFLPNTVFLNLSNFQSKLDIDNVNYSGESARDHTVGGQLLDYVSFLGFAHLDRPPPHVRARWVLDFVPTINLSEKQIEFSDNSPIDGVRFQRWYVSAGYGVEIGHLSRIGYFYFDYAPTVTWTQLTFETQSYREQLRDTALTSMYEFGYNRFITNHLVGKVFARTLNEDNSLWERAVRDITGRTESVANANSLSVGVALGYYLPSSFESKDGWLVTEKSH